MSALPPVSTEPVVGSGRAPERLIVVGAILLGILIAKPWQGSSVPAAPARETPREAAVDEPGTSPSPEPTASAGPNEIACHGGWRLVSITHQANWTIKDWTAVEPSPGPGPVAQDIPFVAVSGAVRAIGVCADGQELGNPDRNVAIGGMWRVTAASGRVTAASIPLEATGDAAQPPAFARLYRPLAVGAAKSWAPGRYVFELAVAGGISWLGIVVPD